jgi:ferredoxin-NADP reductase
MLFKTKINEIIKRTYNVKSFRFSRPSSFNYEAGQFLFVTLTHEKEELKKHFTISSSPTEDYIEFTKKLTGHKFSNALDSLDIGDEIEIDAPHGKFVLGEDKDKIAMLSGGIGITPLRSICKYATDSSLKTDIILLYGNQTSKDIAFREDLSQMEKENQHLRIIHTLSEPPPAWKGYTGYIDEKMIKNEISDFEERQFYTCGPPGMVKAMKKLLNDLNIPEKQIKIENFSGY